MKQRIRCPWHNEKTPSLVRRKSDYYCYGSCTKAYTLQEVAAKGIALEYEEDDECQENLEEKFNYITSLPRREIRGLIFPADTSGYYICWPDKSYYKYRLFEPGRGGKYLSPKGHFPTPFWTRKLLSGTVYVVEGEINAMSIAEAMPSVSVVSPGSASMFKSERLQKLLTILKEYSTVIVVLDDDPAGIKGYIEARAAFMYKLPFVKYLLIKPDANEILSESKEKLRETLQRQNYK